MISLLSEHIYSTPETFVRELLQNGVDAITALRQLDEQHEGRIDVYLETVEGTPQLRFCDNGIGLKEDEVLRFLTIIGESSKRETPEASTYIGQFGIGLLSCFVVSDSIEVTTQSVMNAPAVCWTGKADGTFTLSTPSETVAHGTQIRLVPKAERSHLFTVSNLRSSLSRYGGVLPHAIYLHHDGETERINDDQPVWLRPDATREQLMEECNKVYKFMPLDAIPIHTEAGGVRGALFVLPYRVDLSSSSSHRIFLKRMYLSDDHCGLLPKWAFFARALFNVDELRSTASREALVRTNALRETCEEIGAQIKEHLRWLMVADSDAFEKLLAIHEFHIKALAAEDAEARSLFMPHLSFETNRGYRTFADIEHLGDTVYYTSNVDTFKQVKRVAEGLKMLVVNTCYTFDEDLLKRHVAATNSVKMVEITGSMLMDRFSTPAPSPLLEAFLKHADEVMKTFGCVCQARCFEPLDIPAIFFPGERSQSKKASNPLAQLASKHASTAKPAALAVNANNPLVMQLMALNDDPELFVHILHLLYVQALLQGKYPVSAREMELFNLSLQQLMLRSFHINI